jgi:hypothetical protein
MSDLSGTNGSRLAEARAYVLTLAQLAQLFTCSPVTVERKLAELRALKDPFSGLPPLWLQPDRQRF